MEEIFGHEVVEGVKLRNVSTDEFYTHPTAGVFICIGFHSNINFLDAQLPVDETGHIYTNIDMETKFPGVYAAGDIRSSSFRQLGTAVGDGITAALAAYPLYQ